MSRNIFFPLLLLASAAGVLPAQILPGTTGFNTGGVGVNGINGSSSSTGLITSNQNCTDPAFCSGGFGQQQINPYSGYGNVGGGGFTLPYNTLGYGSSNGSNGNQYVDNGGFNNNNNDQQSQQSQGQAPLQMTDFQRLARESTGYTLPIYGQDLFLKPPSTFAPADQIPVTPDYVLGPGDEVLVRIWGHNQLNSRLTIDRAGNIYVPQVGSVHLSGERVSDMQPILQRELSKTYRNFEFSANLGHLRSIQVYVMGEARRPGAYTVSSLATALNAVFSSGGPTAQGSLRAIEIRRDGKTVATLDLYEFLLRGDKTKDVMLQADDVIFIPFAGPQVALSGAVKHPAVYELLPGGNTSLDDVLKLAGGFNTTATETRLSIERIVDHRERRATTISMDTAGLATKLNDGDILRADSVLRGYRDSVTIRGNLANAGRFPWHPGMHLSEIIPDRESLLTPDYWAARNHLGLPTPLFEPVPPAAPMPPATTPGTVNPTTNATGLNGVNLSGTTMTNGLLPTSTGNPDNQVVTGVQIPTTGPGTLNTTPATPTRLVGATQERDEVLPNAVNRQGNSTVAEQQEVAVDRLVSNNTKRNDITIPAPEIDWSYATIERLDPNTLRNSLVPFHLGKLILEQDPAEDKLLQPGDVITILSQADIHVSQDEQTKYIRLEGEFGSSGVYSVAPGETLADVVKRAGGLTRNAYLYGASFTRESARVLQQQRLDEFIAGVERQEERTGVQRALSANTPYAISQTTDERNLIEQLRKLRATGRVVLEFKPDSTGESAVPAISLENGDSFRVPSTPAIVSVVGSVYGQNVFLYNSKRRVRDYLTLSGKPNRIADKSHEFVIRADGSVLSKETVHSGLWSDNFSAAVVFPGDTIVVPEKPVKPSLVKDLLDYSTILSSFGVGAAAITVLK